MRNLRWTMTNVLFAIGVVFVALSIYFFWNAYQIGEQQLQKAGDETFVIVFTDRIQPEDGGIGNDEMTRLNNRRLRNKNTGWLLMVSGAILLAARSALKRWRRKPAALSIIEKDEENVG